MSPAGGLDARICQFIPLLKALGWPVRGKLAVANGELVDGPRPGGRFGRGLSPDQGMTTIIVKLHVAAPEGAQSPRRAERDPGATCGRAPRPEEGLP